MNLDTFNLHCFITVTEQKSFTKAADILGRTQSAISQQITKLEHSLNRPLLIRGKSLSLSPDGEIFYRYAKKIFEMHCSLIDRFKKPDLQGEVRFGLPEDFASVFLSDVLTSFSRIHPRILLNIECDLTLNLFDRFKNNEFDLALVKMNCLEDFPNGLDIFSEQMVWVGHEPMLPANQPIPLILSPEPCVYRTNAIRALEKSNTPWRIALCTHSHASKMAAVSAGIGMTVLPKNMVPSGTHRVNHSSLLPPLQDIQVSLIKKVTTDAAVNSLEQFIMQKLKDS